MEKQILETGIIVYKNAIPKEWNLINRLEDILGQDDSVYKWQGAKVGYFEDNNSHRNCEDFKYTDNSLGQTNPENAELYKIHKDITDTLKECLRDYQSEYQININWIGAINLVKYGPNEFFNVHSDDGDPYRCTVSCVAYINDDYEGGDLWFKYFDKSYKPEAGDLFLFPSSYIYAHASVPVTSGIKYAIVIMTDRNEFAHRNDSPVYYSMEERSKHGLS